MPESGGAVLGHPRLTNSPLAEAIFELRSKNSRPYTLLPGQFVARLTDTYPSVQELEAAKFAAIAELPLEAGLLVTHRLEAPDQRRLVQLGAAGFSLNLKAYGGYDDFRSEVSRIARLYFDLAGVQAVHRLGLRYMNFVEPRPEAFSALTVRVDWPDLADGYPESVAARTILHYEDPPGQLAVAVGAPDPRGSLLDFDFFWSPARPMSIEEVLSWADRAHERVYDAFRGMVSPEVFASWEAPSISEVG
jgi:uncharacterized protein (TIGR04255 family)